MAVAVLFPVNMIYLTGPIFQLPQLDRFSVDDKAGILYRTAAVKTELNTDYIGRRIVEVQRIYGPVVDGELHVFVYRFNF